MHGLGWLWVIAGLMLPPQNPEGAALLWNGHALELILSYASTSIPWDPQNHTFPLEIAYQIQGARPSAGFLYPTLNLDSPWVFAHFPIPLTPEDSIVRVSLTLYDRGNNKVFLKLSHTFRPLSLAILPIHPNGSLRIPIFTTEDTLWFRIALPHPGSLIVKLLGKNANKIVWKRFSQDTVETLAIPANFLTDGEYEIQVTQDHQTQSLRIALWGMRGLSDHEWKEYVFLLQLAFPDSNFSYLLKLPKSERRTRFFKIWEETDPNPTTPILEHYAQFRQRIREVDQMFRVGTIPGYRTHQGMVYLKYGTPDWIERRPFEMERRPTEIWIYEKPRRMVFMFEDRQGIGVYTLVDTDPPGIFP